jgi:hypothetical protein
MAAFLAASDSDDDDQSDEGEANDAHLTPLKGRMT